MSDFDSKTIHLTPAGVSIWPKLTEPETKFNPEGVYNVRLRLNETDEAALIDKLTSLFDLAYAENCKTEKKAKLKKADFPWKPEVTKDNDGNEIETGSMVFTFKMAATGKTKAGKKYTQKPGIFDGQGKSLNGVLDLDIGGGSEMLVAYTVRPFYTATIGSGISLKLKSVQLTKLVSFGERTAESFGFKPIAGAYSSAPKANSHDDGSPDAPPAGEDGTDGEDF